MSCTCVSRRAAALLITLAATAIVTASLVSLAGAAASAGSAHCASLRSAMADDLLLVSDGLVAEWLRRESPHVSLSPEAVEPRTGVLADTFDLAGQPATITITGWDQQGMVPVALGRSGSPLRLTLPGEAQRVLDAVARATEPYGVDQLDAISDSPAFPSPASDGPPRAGALIATHAGGRAGAAININTAPAPLLRAAMREAGAGGLGAILSARAAGKRARVGAVDRRPGPRRRDASVTLTDTSSAWAIRTDISIGPMMQSWWSVWERRSGGWQLVQRLEITR